MKMICVKPFAFTLAALTLFLFQAKAQITSPYSVGINAGAFIYNGDLTPWKTGSWKTPAFVLGLTGHRNFSPTLAARLDVSFGNLKGDEAKYVTPEYRQYRAFAFKTRVTEVALAAEWSPLGRTSKFYPYAFAGIGYSGLRVTRDYSRFKAEYFTNEPTLYENLQVDIAHSLPRGVIVFPAGLGLAYQVSPKISLHGEAAQRLTFSDYIDGFSKAGNPNQNDSYAKYSLGLRFAFGNKDPYACPTIRY